MTPNWAERLDGWARSTVPALTALLLLFVSMVPTGLPDASRMMPALVLAAIYYWSVHRPDLMPAVLAFALGLAHDALSGGPPGLMALIAVLVHGACVSQRRTLMGRIFPLEWVACLMILLAAHLTIWAVASLYYVTVLDGGPILIQLALLLLVYPILSRLLAASENWMLKAA